MASVSKPQPRHLRASASSSSVGRRRRLKRFEHRLGRGQIAALFGDQALHIRKRARAALAPFAGGVVQFAQRRARRLARIAQGR